MLQAADNSVLDTADILGIVGLVEELVCNAVKLADTADILGIVGIADTADILGIVGLADTDDIQEE